MLRISDRAQVCRGHCPRLEIHHRGTRIGESPEAVRNLGAGRGQEMEGDWTRTDGICRHAERACICHRSLSVRPPFPALGLHPGPWQPLGIHLSGSLCLPCVPIIPLLCYVASWHLLVFGFLMGVCFSRWRGARAPPLPDNLPPPPLRATWTRRSCWATPPFSLPPFSLPPFSLPPLSLPPMSSLFHLTSWSLWITVL